MKAPESAPHEICQIRRLVIATLPGDQARRAPANQFQHPARKEPWMRRRLRRSLPFLLAIFFGMIAGILVAGVAILAAHP
jgi:hypothetical protein